MRNPFLTQWFNLFTPPPLFTWLFLACKSLWFPQQMQAVLWKTEECWGLSLVSGAVWSLPVSDPCAAAEIKITSPAWPHTFSNAQCPNLLFFLNAIYQQLCFPTMDKTKHETDYFLCIPCCCNKLNERMRKHLNSARIWKCFFIPPVSGTPCKPRWKLACCLFELINL